MAYWGVSAKCAVLHLRPAIGVGNERVEKMKKCPDPYWKYDLVIAKPFIATIKTPYINHLEKIINTFHYGLHYDLKMICPYRLTKDKTMRYKGQYWITKLGKIKVRF